MYWLSRSQWQHTMFTQKIHWHHWHWCYRRAHETCGSVNGTLASHSLGIVVPPVIKFDNILLITIQWRSLWHIWAQSGKGCPGCCTFEMICDAIILTFLPCTIVLDGFHASKPLLFLSVISFACNGTPFCHVPNSFSITVFLTIRPTSKVSV